MKTIIISVLIPLLLILSSTLYSQTGPWAKYDSKLKNDALVREADGGNLAEVKSIVAGGGNVNVQLEQTKLSPLMAAASAGKAEVVRYLLSEGADPGAKDWNGYTALDRAKWSGSAEVIKLINDALQKNTPQPEPEKPKVVAKKEEPKKNEEKKKQEPVIIKETAKGNLAWPAFGSYAIGDSIMYYVPTGWRRGAIKKLGTIVNKERKFIPDEKKYLVDPDAFALSDDWYEWSQVVKLTREPFWTSWFIGEWKIGEVGAHNNKIENGKETDTYYYTDATETLRIMANGTYSWKQTNGKTISGRWKPATDGPGVVLIKAYREFDWTIRNYTMPDDLHIRKLEVIRLHPSKNVGSITGKRSAT